MRLSMISDGDAAALFRRLAMMSGAGMPLADAFRSCAPDFAGFVQMGIIAVADGISGGAYPDDAMRGAGIFPAHACGLVAAGSESGKLEDAFLSLYAYHSRMDGMKARLRRAVVQPASMLAMSGAVFILVCTKVLPVFDGIYSRMGMGLDGFPGALLQAGTWMQRHAGGIGLSVLAVAALSVSAMMAGPVRRRAGRWFGRFFRSKRPLLDMSDARYVQAVAMGLDAGMDVAEASRMAAGLCDDGDPLKCRYDAVSAAVTDGARFHEACRSSGIMPVQAACLVDTGFLSGRGPEAVREAAAMMLDDAEAAVDRMSAMIEPAMSAAGAVMVGATVLSAMLPLLGVMASIN